MTFARIKMLHARKANTSVIFRRGPSKWVQVLKWNTKTDEITEGQWFNGRIYTDKSDLSPYGNYMIYFAAKFKEEKNQYTWTAISKPPYLTAIALWKKNDTFDGGGLFESTRKIYLNHVKEEAKVEEGADISELKITLNTARKFPHYDIEGVRMRRDNWEWSKDKLTNLNNSDIQIAKKISAEASIVYTGFKVTNHKYDWHSFVMYKGEQLNFDSYENIDINRNQRILLSKGGCIYTINDLELYLKNRETTLIADLNDNKRYEMEAPEEMRKW